MYNSYSIESFINYINNEDEYVSEGIKEFFMEVIESIKRTIRMIMAEVTTFIPNAIVRLKNIGNIVKLQKPVAYIVKHRIPIQIASLLVSKSMVFKEVIKNPDTAKSVLNEARDLCEKMNYYKDKDLGTEEVSVNAILSTINAMKLLEIKMKRLLEESQKLVDKNPDDENKKRAGGILIGLSNIIIKITKMTTEIYKSAISQAKSIDLYKNKYEKFQKE